MQHQMKRLTLVKNESWDLPEGNVALAAVIQLKARIARRESRLKELSFDLNAMENGPQLQPAA